MSDEISLQQAYERKDEIEFNKEGEMYRFAFRHPSGTLKNWEIRYPTSTKVENGKNGLITMEFSEQDFNKIKEMTQVMAEKFAKQVLKEKQNSFS